jgi:hypothetical protein
MNLQFHGNKKFKGNPDASMQGILFDKKKNFLKNNIEVV